MICPTCGAAGATIISTGRGEHGTVRHVRECQHGHRFPTFEVTAPVWNYAKHRARAVNAAAVKRVGLRKRDMAIAGEIHTGAELVAANWGISVDAVYQAARRGRQYIEEEAYAAAHRRGGA